MLVALYLGQSAEPIFRAAEGFVTKDLREVACRLLLNPTRHTESPRCNAGSVEHVQPDIFQVGVKEKRRIDDKKKVEGANWRRN